MTSAMPPRISRENQRGKVTMTKRLKGRSENKKTKKKKKKEIFSADFVTFSQSKPIYTYKYFLQK